MLIIQKNVEPRFKTVFYKGVELFVHRDTTKKPVQLRLYDALSGWIVAAGMTKAEARYHGITNPIEGKNEEELIQILEHKLTGHDLKGESFKELITRRRGENPPREEQQAILEAYVEAKAASDEAVSTKNGRPTNGHESTKVAVEDNQQPRKTPLQSHFALWRECSSACGRCSGEHSTANRDVDTHPPRHPHRRS
jgi:hypothetical protein